MCPGECAWTLKGNSHRYIFLQQHQKNICTLCVTRLPTDTWSMCPWRACLNRVTHLQRPDRLQRSWVLSWTCSSTWSQTTDAPLDGRKTGANEGRLERKKEGNDLFNNTLNTFYLRLYGIGYMVKDHSDSERGNLLPLHELLFPINSKGSFICTIPQTG